MRGSYKILRHKDLVALCIDAYYVQHKRFVKLHLHHDDLILLENDRHQLYSAATVSQEQEQGKNKTMSSAGVGLHMLRIASGPSGFAPCSRSLLRQAVRQNARHRQQLHTSTTRTTAGPSQHFYSSNARIGSLRTPRWSWSNGSRNGGKRGSSLPPPRTAWLLMLPLSMSKMQLDDSTMTEKAHDFYEHAIDLSLNEKASLLEEGEQLSLWDRFLTSLHRYIIEPLGTARRFLFLAILFIPVIATAPLLALEWSNDKSSPAASKKKQSRKYQERATTRWWYSFLVRQMERAGPTFIKVCLILMYEISTSDKHSLIH